MSLRDRFSRHCNYVDRNVEATGRHFHLPGHQKSDMKVTICEKVHSQNVWVRQEIESKFIGNANSFYKGINLKP